MEAIALTQDSKDRMLKDILQDNEVFIDAVAENRGLDRKYVSKLADGRSYTGTDALKNKLVDQLGDFQDAKDYLSKEIDEEVKACEY